MFQLHQFMRVGLMLVVVAIVTGGAQAAKVAAPVVIESVTIEDGVAIVTGSVNTATTQLEINGQPVDLSETGAFVTAIDLDAGTLVLSLVEADSDSVTLRIPIDVLIANGGAGILNDLLGAGVSIHVPVDGFTLVDGQWPLVVGNVLNVSLLDHLTINGVNVLDRIGPMGNFALQLPSSQSQPPQSQVVVVAGDRRGVSQTTIYRVTGMQSTISTRTGTSVSAAGARGLVIAGIRFDKRSLASAGRVRVLVTVKDRRGYFVRGAALRLSATPRKHLATGWLRAGFTNDLGRAQFTYRLRVGAFSRNAMLTVVARAKTPAAGAARKASLRLPVLNAGN